MQEETVTKGRPAAGRNTRYRGMASRGDFVVCQTQEGSSRDEDNGSLNFSSRSRDVASNFLERSRGNARVFSWGSRNADKINVCLRAACKVTHSRTRSAVIFSHPSRVIDIADNKDVTVSVPDVRKIAFKADVVYLYTCSLQRNT